MNKINILLIISALLLVFNLCGCINNNENSRIIGTWKAIEYSSDPVNQSDPLELTWTFYDNGSLSFTSRILNNSTANNTSPIIQFIYEFNNNLLCISRYNDQVNISQQLCFDYKFSNNNNQLTLKHEDGPPLILYRE